MGALRSCFARTQTWLQAGKYVNALASELPSRNGWSIAEQCGNRSPDCAQRLLNRASWDEAAAMSQVRRHAAAGLDAAVRRCRRKRMAVGALDETGQEKQGSCTVGRESRPVPTGPPSGALAVANSDDILAAVLIRMWSLASGRTLRCDVRPDQLTEEELIGFWADDIAPASGRHAIPRGEAE